MNLEIITPDKKLFKGEITSVKLPGSMGSFMILNNHAPIISTLEKGTVTVVTRDSAEKVFEIVSGLVEVKKNNIVVLAETA